MAKTRGNDPQNEIKDPSAFFGGYAALSSLQGGQSVMPGVQASVGFEPKEASIGGLVRPEPSSLNNSMKFNS